MKWTFLHIKNMWIKQLSNLKVWDFGTAFWVWKLFGTFEKRAPGLLDEIIHLHDSAGLNAVEGGGGGWGSKNDTLLSDSSYWNWSPEGFGLFSNVIHQIFSLASDKSKHITWLNMPLLKLGNITRIFPNFQNRACCEKCLKDNKHNSLHLGQK